jgi:hypothetical protein
VNDVVCIPSRLKVNSKSGNGHEALPVHWALRGLRKHSAQEQFLNTIAEELLPSDSSLTLYRLHNLPRYNEDQDGPSAPDAVLELRQALWRRTVL